jgi:hypothetical protein
MLAVDLSHGTECLLLINWGADIRIKDKKGLNVFHHAFVSGRQFDEIMMIALGKWFGMKYTDIFMANARECIKG